MQIRPATEADANAIWQILEPVIRQAETYTFPADWAQDQAIAYWFNPAHQVFVAEESGCIAGTYFLRRNQTGGGSHVANCGYITAAQWTSRGIARAMCLHSLEQAKLSGFSAMQFNFVVASNQRAVRLWQSLDFKIVGRLPGAFKHPALGLVDAFVMFRKLS